jgi:hypothetical protein
MNEIDSIMQSLPHKILDKFDDGDVLLPADDKQLTHFEGAIQCKLPPHFRDFLKNYQGSCLYDVVFVTENRSVRLEPGDCFSLSSFLGFYKRHQKPQDLVWQYQRHKSVFPVGMIAIAESGDNLFCISCATETFDHVFAWLPPEFEDDNPSGEFVLLAFRFLEFLRSLRLRD